MKQIDSHTGYEPVAVVVRGRVRAHVMWLGNNERTLPRGMNLYTQSVVSSLLFDLAEAWASHNKLEQENMDLRAQVEALIGEAK